MYTANRLEWHQGDEIQERTLQITVVDLDKASSEAFACISIALLLLTPRAKIHQSDLRGFCIWKTGHRQTAFKAAVTVLRGNGGSFPSQAQMSDPQGCAGTGRRDALRRVILQVVQSVRHSPMYVPDLSEIYMVLTNLVYSGLGEYCPNRTRLN